jgi:hypothetical protein
MTLELAPTEDILAEVVRRRRPGQLIVGFAAETENRMENGRAKLLRKGADAIVVNDVTGEGVGIDADTNAATFLTLTTAVELPRCPSGNWPTAFWTRFSRCADRGRWCLSLTSIQDAQTRRAAIACRTGLLEETVPAVSARGQLIVE